MQFTIDNAPHVMSRVASGGPQNQLQLAALPT